MTLIFFAACGLQAGCAVDRDREVAIYRQVLDATAATRPADLDDGGPLSLSAALWLANQHNEQLAISGEDYVQALADKDRVASAFFPTLTLVPSYSIADDADDSGSRRVQGGGTADPNEVLNRASLSTGDGRLDVPINTNVNVFRGFRDLAALNAARNDIDRFRALLLDLQATVLLDTATAYYQVLQSEAAVRVLESSSRLQDARVSEIQARDRVGSARKIDVAQAEAQAANTRAQLAAAYTDVANARILLSFLTASPMYDVKLVDRLDVPAGPMDLKTALGEAWSTREDLKAARAAVRAAGANVQTAVGQYYPSVGVNFNYYLSRQSNPEDSLWNALISLNLPIFTAGRIRSDVRIAMSQLRQAEQNQQLVARQIEQQLRTALANLDASTRRLKELRTAVDAAQQALAVAEGNYNAGTGIYLERLVAQDQLLSAQLQLAGEDYNQKLQYLNLLRILGRLHEPPPESDQPHEPTTRLLTESRPTTRPDR